MKALINTKKMVVEIVNDGKEFPVHPDLKWMTCDNSVTIGDNYIDNKFVKSVKKEMPLDDKIRSELPLGSEQLDALWSWAISGDKTEINNVEARRQVVFDKYK